MTTIARVTTTTSSVPLHTPFVTALRRTETTDTVVVTVTDSDGRTGWGEAPQVWQVTGESLASATACIETMLAPALTGLRLDDRADLATAAAAVQRAVARNFGAKAALDAALHDLVAQAEGTSVAAVLANRADGIRDVLTTDVTLSAGAADGLADAARARVAGGFRTLKMKVGTDASTDVQRVAAVRDAVGPGVALRLDANQGWTREEAVQVIRALEVADLGVEFVEQPVVADDVEGLAWVRERVGLPVMADESCYGPYDLERIIRLGAADLVNVKLAKCGSLSVGPRHAAASPWRGAAHHRRVDDGEPCRGGRRSGARGCRADDRGQRPRRGVVVRALARARRNHLRGQPDPPSRRSRVRHHGIRRHRLTRPVRRRAPPERGPSCAQERSVTDDAEREGAFAVARGGGVEPDGAQ